MTRREFIKQAALVPLVAGFLNSKPVFAKDNFPDDENDITAFEDQFTQPQKAVLQAVQLQLFPDDGDGPSATDIQALSYLEWALTDLDNIEDGDRVIILRGVGWLNELTKEKYSANFHQISKQQQHTLMQQLSKSEAGENWMSLLIYYLLEALLLDPVYGGNTDSVGWRWLQHQPGFPRPDNAHLYRHYQS